MSEVNATNTCCPCEPANSIKLPVTGLDLSLNIDASALDGVGGGLSREEVAQMIEVALQNMGGTGDRQWRSDWFNIAANSSHTITHNLGLQSPEKCDVRLVAKVKTAAAGWEVGDIIFADGSNNIGSMGSTETGWAISLKENSAHISFGNLVSYIWNKKSGGCENLPKANVQCSLVIDY